MPLMTETITPATLLNTFSEENLAANWCITPATGQWLAWLCYTLQADTILEIGTSIGYSGLWMLSALSQRPKGHLHTLDVNPERQQQALANFTTAGMAQRVTLHTGEAKTVLPAILPLINATTGLSHELDLTGLDLIFLDAHKADYGWYVEQVAPWLKPGGVIVADNTTSHGHAMDSFFTTIKTLGWPCAELATLGSGLWMATKPHQ
jgi:caffeoyl-CoA O-methyltransferase